jgi:hypothetical protein
MPRSQDELHAGLVLVGAVAVLVEHAYDGLAAVQQALLGDKLVEQLRLGGQRSQSAADHHVESAPSLAEHRAQPDIVDRARDRILPRAAIEGDLEFARQIAREILAQKGVRHFLRVGAHVENFVAGDAGQGADGDVAHGVVAGLAIGQPHVRQQVHKAGDARQRHEMVLNVLPRGEVAPAAAEFVRDARELLHLPGSEQAARDLAAHHLNSRLPLPVDTVLEPERAKLVLRDFAGEECLRLPAEDFDLFADGAVVLLFELGRHDLTLLDRHYHNCRERHNGTHADI